MITTIVEFKLPEPISGRQAKDIFLGTSGKYKGLPGLIRKYYFLTEDCRISIRFTIRHCCCR